MAQMGWASVQGHPAEVDAAGRVILSPHPPAVLLRHRPSRLGKAPGDLCDCEVVYSSRWGCDLRSQVSWSRRQAQALSSSSRALCLATAAVVHAVPVI